MIIDFSKLSTTAKESLLEPRDIFMSLPNKDSRYGYPRDVQTEVWKQWYGQRNTKNTIIKMNTGSGKTVVGLVILQSCLNEGKGPAVYVVPDNYLVSQVCAEAKKLGISVVFDKFDDSGECISKGEEQYAFKNKSAIFVTSISKLVNGKSIFGMRLRNNIPIGSIIIDDVHACMDIIEQQYTVKIDAEYPVYNQIIQKFIQYQEIKNNNVFWDVTERQDPRANKLIPFWAWQECSEDILRLLKAKEYEDKPFALFNIPLLQDNWKTCNCVISTKEIEITPKCIPMSKIMSFENAERRIFMSATLSDDSVFVSTMGLDADEIKNIITPEKANDIGERFILFPNHLNPQIEDIDMIEQIQCISHNYNSVVIVPSFERAAFWKNNISGVPVQVLSSHEKNIESGISSLKNNAFVGVTILVNKYDGVDLPDSACRFLVIDGLPAMRSHYDAVLNSMNPNDKRLCRESIQKIEQGMGRGVRSNNDYCVVVLMGVDLAEALVNQEGERFFSNATKQQYSISRQLWDQLMENNESPSLSDIFELSEFVINRDKSWVTAIRSALNSVEYNKSPNIDSIVVSQRRAFEEARIERYDKAFAIIEEEKNKNTSLNDKAKGVLMQLMAEYKNFTNPAQAQELMLSAKRINDRVLNPISGAQYQKLQVYSEGQAANVITYLKSNFSSINNYLIHVNSILKDLNFSAGTYNAFEEAIKSVAEVIGIHASRPEKEGQLGGPDDLWALGDLKYAVIECKNGIDPKTTYISKSDSEQLLSSVQWFKNTYMGNGFECCPVMIHRVNILDKEASADPTTRIMTVELLEKFKTAIKDFAVGLTSEVLADPKEVSKLLNYYRLNSNIIIESYTITVKGI